MHSVTDTEQLSFSVRQVAQRWGYESIGNGEQAVRRLVRDGKIPAFKVGRAYRIRLADIEAYELGGSAAA